MFENFDFEKARFVVEALERALGGKPRFGRPQSFVYSMALQLRQIYGADKELLDKIIPTYGETKEQREKVIQNMTEALLQFGIRKPNIALLALVEKPSFHMKDTVEAQTIVMRHQEEPLADCTLYGPIAYDLIMSKEAARLKHFDCEACGEFDGIVVPNLMAGNLICKVWDTHIGAIGSGILAGTTIPIALSGRATSPESAFLSLTGSIAMFI